jgi:ATP-dependent Lon protease
MKTAVMNQQDDTTNIEFIPKTAGTPPARADEVLPETLQLIPLEGRPYFPVLVQPIVVNQEPWGEGLKIVAESAHKLIALSYVAANDTHSGEIPEPGRINEIGCVARIRRIHAADGKIQFIAQGIRRFRIKEWVSSKPPYVVRVEYPEESIDGDDAQIRAYAMSLINIIKELMSLNPLYNEELKQYLNYFDPNEPSALSDFAAAITSADASELQEILETFSLMERMEKVLLLISKELEIARIQAKITADTQEQLSEQQKEFFLRQQLKVIQKELGITKDDRDVDLDEFRSRLEALVVPDHVQARVDEELKKLQILEPASAEYGVTRNYLDWITSVPWGVTTADTLDLKHARKVLDQDHDGLDDVKQRIIEFLAVGAYRGEISGSILLLVGPPGVGKTSIGKSIAEALGRKFYRFSLGGMRDEAEIKGHRRTYVGAMPGKLVQALKDVDVQNPVIMLDEVDKIGASYQGDPASALLEVLDPEQNSEFLDHYLDLRVDLSKVLFICTANQLDTIPAPLLDRMETIRLAGYLTAEKQTIARNHLWKRQLSRAGIPSSKLKISDAALKLVIDGYAREAGVRNLDKQLSRLVRSSVLKLLENPKKSVSLGKNQVEEILGAPIFKKQKPRSGVGVVNGLAWTSLGGTTLAVEATQVHDGNRGFKQTGQLGSVMQESAQIAYSYVASNLDKLGVRPDFFDNAMIHLHVPEGATPKDGPSAGITMATSLLSLAMNKPIKRNVGMTGELTLTGKVLPIGGVTEKIIACKRAGISEVILPIDNQRDFDEMPDYLKENLTVHFAAEYIDVAKLCFAGS